MSEHTKGRLKAVRDDLMLEAGRFRMARGVTACGSSKGMIDEREVSSANARRLAAAWNACESMTTEAIEALVGIGSLGNLKASELDAANARIAKLEALVAERDAWLGQRPCRNNRCSQLVFARSLLSEVAFVDVNDMLEIMSLRERATSYLDACNTMEKK